jgi:hypothetical protein
MGTNPKATYISYGRTTGESTDCMKAGGVAINIVIADGVCQVGAYKRPGEVELPPYLSVKRLWMSLHRLFTKKKKRTHDTY